MKEKIVEEYFKVADSKAVDVLLWLLKNRDSTNKVLGTLDSIAVDCAVTKVTVNRIFQKLYNTGFMTKIRNGQYQMHKI